MLQFFQTRMGLDFFNSTMPRLVKALEKIAANSDSNLVERVEVLELALSLPPNGEVTCKDGFTFMIGGRELSGGKLVLLLPSQRDSLIEDYLVTREEGLALRYSDVPPAVVAQLIINHGGLDA